MTPIAIQRVVGRTKVRHAHQVPHAVRRPRSRRELGSARTAPAHFAGTGPFALGALPSSCCTTRASAGHCLLTSIMAAIRAVRCIQRPPLMHAPPAETRNRTREEHFTRERCRRPRRRCGSTSDAVPAPAVVSFEPAPHGDRHASSKCTSADVPVSIHRRRSPEATRRARGPPTRRRREVSHRAALAPITTVAALSAWRLDQRSLRVRRCDRQHARNARGGPGESTTPKFASRVGLRREAGPSSGPEGRERPVAREALGIAPLTIWAPGGPRGRSARPECLEGSRDRTPGKAVSPAEQVPQDAPGSETPSRHLPANEARRSGASVESARRSGDGRVSIGVGRNHHWPRYRHHAKPTPASGAPAVWPRTSPRRAPLRKPDTASSTGASSLTRT
jgi:hypothetical protein